MCLIKRLVIQNSLYNRIEKQNVYNKFTDFPILVIFRILFLKNSEIKKKIN